MIKALCFAFLLAGMSSLQAYTVTLDWNSVDWTAVTTSTSGASQSFDIDPNNPGNDITITITRVNTNSFFSNDPYGGTPINDGTIVTGGAGTSNESLHIFADHNSTTNGIQITITFNYDSGVEDVAFTVYDVDTSIGQYRDRLDSFTGTLDGSTTSTAVITKSSYNNDDTTSTLVRGDYLANRNAEPDESLGNAGISYSSGVVDQVSFVWSNDGESGYQGIAISDITYTVIPEPSTCIIGGLLVLLIGYSHFRKRQNDILDVA